jgi:hypothetical protein
MVTRPGFLTRKDQHNFLKFMHENVIKMKNKPAPALFRPLQGGPYWRALFVRGAANGGGDSAAAACLIASGSRTRRGYKYKFLVWRHPIYDRGGQVTDEL